MRKVVTIVVLSMATIVASAAKDGPVLVEGPKGYNCWPMIQAVDGRLVCVYTCGKVHNPGELGRGTYARFSANAGDTWSDRVTVCVDPKSAESPVAKGLDESGNALFVVRRFGNKPRFAFYRTRDGRKFDLACEAEFEPKPMQVTDIFKVPGVGLMAFWFGGSYADDDRPRWWGIITSKDNGKTWQQRVCGEGMAKRDWPTEPSGVWLGNGRILAIARTECGEQPQFQLTSVDSGKTWKVVKTEIRDVGASTPSLIYDPKTDLVSMYYYHRGPGVLRCRTARASEVFADPMKWPASKALVEDHGYSYDSGNANAVEMNGRHFVAYYTGKAPDCSVMVLSVER